jgi:hypothetical protein
VVIHGDADRTVPIAAWGLRTANLIKGARLVIVPDGPHCITWTHAEQVNPELVNFLGQKLGARGGSLKLARMPLSDAVLFRGSTAKLSIT